MGGVRVFFFFLYGCGVGLPGRTGRLILAGRARASTTGRPIGPSTARLLCRASTGTVSIGPCRVTGRPVSTARLHMYSFSVCEHYAPVSLCFFGVSKVILVITLRCKQGSGNYEGACSQIASLTSRISLAS